MIFQRVYFLTMYGVWKSVSLLIIYTLNNHSEINGLDLFNSI